MRWGNKIRTAIATLVVVIVAAPAALAATPAEIYRDLADGRLDGQYSQADLERALANPTAQGYPGQAQGVLQQQIAAQRGTEAKQVDSLPFTGLELGLTVAGGMLLLGIGASLRRVARRQPSA